MPLARPDPLTKPTGAQFRQGLAERADDPGFRPLSRRRRLLLVLLAIATGLSVAMLLAGRPGGASQPRPAAAAPAPPQACAPGQTEGCVGGRAPVFVVPAAAPPAPAAASHGP